MCLLFVYCSCNDRDKYFLRSATSPTDYFSNSAKKLVKDLDAYSFPSFPRLKVGLEFTHSKRCVPLMLYYTDDKLFNSAVFSVKQWGL